MMNERSEADVMNMRLTPRQAAILAELFERTWVDGKPCTLGTTLSRRTRIDHKTLTLTLPSLNGRGLVGYGGLGYQSMGWWPPKWYKRLPWAPDKVSRKHEQFEIWIQCDALPRVAQLLRKSMRAGHPVWDGLKLYAEHQEVDEDVAGRAELSLLPCPFCGAEGETIDPYGWVNGDDEHGPQCPDCGATAESDEKWNVRAG